MKKIILVILSLIAVLCLCGAAMADTCTINLGVDPAGGGTVSGGGTFVKGETITIEAKEQPGWKFIGWDDGDSRQICTFTVKESATYIAKFIHETEFIVQAGEGGTVTPSGTVKYTDGTPVTLRAIPNPGWEFEKWSDGDPKQETTFSVIDSYQGMTFTASFKKRMITLSASAGTGGTIVGDTSKTQEYSDSESKTFTAKASEGYVLDGWYIGDICVGTGETITHTFTENMHFVARFKEKESVSEQDNPGSELIDPKPDPLPPDPDPVPKPPYPYKEFKITYHPGVYGAGSAVTDTAYPGIGWLRGTTFTRPGYIQAGWSWDPYGKEFNAALNAPMPMLYENITVYPYWEPIKGPLVLTVGYSGSGAIQVNGRYVYNGESFTIRPGESLTFGFYPASGNYVYSVLLAGRYREYPGYGFTVSYDMMQNRNQTLAVRFESVYTRPKTGDDSNIALWAALGICSAVCLGVLLIAKKKKK